MMGILGFVVLVSVVAMGYAASPPCITECPQDCGERVISGSCLECICDQPFFKEPPPPRRRDPNCPQVCPQDCGQTRQPNGCLKCECGSNPFYKPTPRPPSKNTRQTDSQLCFSKCPQDCGCLVKNGVAECDCTAGPNHPLIRPRPPTPQRGRRTSQPPNPAMFCRQKCQPDCGCTINDAGEAVCHCSAENHPLIKRPIPPPPPRPSRGNNGRYPPPMVQCSPPKCDAPCVLKSDSKGPCPYCSCPYS